MLFFPSNGRNYSFGFYFWTNTGVPEGLPRVLELKEDSRRPISLTNLFEVVADDLLTLNKNLQSVSALFISPGAV